jgi:hypothetical protein
MCDIAFLIHNTQADMLAECCKFGKIICLMSPEGPAFDSLGCIAVTFESMTAARECASSLHGRWFDSRQIETLVFSPPEISPFTAYSSSQVQHGVEGKVATVDRTRPLISNTKEDQGSSTVLLSNSGNTTNNPTNSNPVDIENKIDCPEVDDFLNSFL